MANHLTPTKNLLKEFSRGGTISNDMVWYTMRVGLGLHVC